MIFQTCKSSQITPDGPRGATPEVEVTKMYRAYRTSTFTEATPVGYRSQQAVRPPPANVAGPHGLRRARSAPPPPSPQRRRAPGAGNPPIPGVNRPTPAQGAP